MTTPAASSVENKNRRFRIDGQIPRRRLPLAYRCALGFVAFTMVLLPILYFALIALVGYGTYFYLVHGIVVFELEGPALARVFAYIGPPFMGIVLLGFMLKPIFTRVSRERDAIPVDLEAHPELAALISEVCAAVGTPMPVEVEVDCAVNASARLRRGLWSLGRRDLVLCIGLPLAGGLTGRQLAGVLAHEFGHFSQRAGMAFSYVIRTVNFWFARVVFERDDWDEILERRSTRGDYRVIALFACARGGLWLSRKILYGLMTAGHVVSCLQLRQMEYDADYYETLLAGSDEFEATCLEIRRLAGSAELALGDLQKLWATRQAVSDMPALVASHRMELTAATLAKLDETARDQATKWTDTHPSDAQRIAHARSPDARGILQADGRASDLFTSFADLSQQATARFYSIRRLTVNPNAIVPPTKLRESTHTGEAIGRAWKRLAGQIVDLNRPIQWRITDFAPLEMSASTLRAELAECRAELARHRPQAQRDAESFTAALEHVVILEKARTLLSCGMSIEPRQFRLSKATLAEAETDLQEARARAAKRASDLAPFTAAVQRWITLVGSAARTPALAEAWSTADRTEIIRLSEALVTHDAWFREFATWVQIAEALNNFTRHEAAGRSILAFNRAAEAERERAKGAVAHAIKLMTDVPNPFAPEGQLPTTASSLQKALEGVFGAGRLAVLLRHTGYLYFQSLGRLALHGEQLEFKLAPPAAPPPLPPGIR